MSTVVFAGQACVDPKQVHADASRLGWPIAWTAWLNPPTRPHQDVDNGQGQALLPNSWTNCRGTHSGQGWILLSLASLGAIDLDDEHPLTFSLDPKEVAGLKLKTAQTCVQERLHVVKAACITSGLRTDPAAAYLVELADPRRLARRGVIDAAYNVLSTPGDDSDYFSATLNGSDPWTWETMTADVWDILADWLGEYPGLPFSPDGVPTNFNFYGNSPAIDALGFILDRLGCALVMDAGGEFDIVRLGAADPVFALALAARDNLRVWDEDPVLPNLGRVPAFVLVQFPAQRAVADDTGGSPWYTVSVAGPGSEGTAVVNDDLAAVYDDSDTLINAAALASRAAERAAAYLQTLAAPIVQRYYGLPLPDSGLQPGPNVESVRWGDRGRGMVTEVVNDPRALPSPRHQMQAVETAGGVNVQWVRILSASVGSYGWPAIPQKTTSAGPIDAGTITTSDSIPSGVRTVTPASMSGIAVGVPLLVVDSLGNSEVVVPTATSSLTFTATFGNSYSAYPVTGIAITDGGGGYTSGSPPTAAFSGGSGSGAAAGAVTLSPVSGSGGSAVCQVAAAAVSAPGSEYSPTAPTVAFSGGTGNSAAATALVGGPVQIVLGGCWALFVPSSTNPGWGYIPVALDVTTPNLYLAQVVGSAGVPILLAQQTVSGSGPLRMMPAFDETGAGLVPGSIIDGGVTIGSDAGNGIVELTLGVLQLDDPNNGTGYASIQAEADEFVSNPITGSSIFPDCGLSMNVEPPDWIGNPATGALGRAAIYLEHFPASSGPLPSFTVLTALDNQGATTGNLSSQLQMVVSPPGYNTILYANISYTEDPTSFDVGNDLVTRTAFGLQTGSPYATGIVLNCGAWPLSPGPTGTGSNITIDGAPGQTGTGGGGDSFIGGICTALGTGGTPDASVVTYTPGDASNWAGAPPATLQDALDRLAAWIASNATVFGTLGITTQP